ncbi:MAG: DnaD domain protein, partial [Armatimonadia bacterium]
AIRMPADSWPWFRAFGEMVGDRKLARVAADLGVPRPMVLGIWTGLLCLASASVERGVLLVTAGVPMRREEIAEELGCERKMLDDVLGRMTELGMVGEREGAVEIIHWGERQFKSDSSRERVAAYRARTKRRGNVTGAEVGNVTETLRDGYSNGGCNDGCNVTVTPPDTDTDTDPEDEAAARAREVAAPMADGSLSRRGAETAQPTDDPLVAEIVRLWEDRFGRPHSDVQREQIVQHIEEFGAERVRDALREMVLSNGKSIRYLDKVLRGGGAARESPGAPPGRKGQQQGLPEVDWAAYAQTVQQEVNGGR